MGKKNQTERNTKAVRIHPDLNTHEELESIQAYMKLEDGRRVNKDELCSMLLKQGISSYQSAHPNSRVKKKRELIA